MARTVHRTVSAALAVEPVPLAAAAGPAAEDLRLPASAVLAESGRKRRISGAHTPPEPTEETE